MWPRRDSQPTQLPQFAATCPIRPRRSGALTWRQKNGVVGIGLSACVQVPWADWADKASARESSMPTCTRDFPWTTRAPKRLRKYLRTNNKTAGSPQPSLSAICVVRAPTASPVPRETKYGRGPNVDIRNFGPTRADGFSERNEYRSAVLREAAGAPFKPYGDPTSFQIWRAPRRSHSTAARRDTSRRKPSAC